VTNCNFYPEIPCGTPGFPKKPRFLLFATSLVPLWYLGIRGGKEKEPGYQRGTNEEEEALPGRAIEEYFLY
jgi:hypothetical protein